MLVFRDDLSQEHEMEIAHFEMSTFALYAGVVNSKSPSLSV